MDESAANVYEVRNVEEAVELAQSFKEQGQYDWFRGQVRDFPPHSSLHRANRSGDQERRRVAVHRLDMFSKWVDKTPELAYLLEPEHVHDFFAIMQHYGIPTHYIDFTTEPSVAGFFAADTSNPPSEGTSCIYCLRSEDLVDVWDSLRDCEERQGTAIELVRINVRNLWRLQAQNGVFIYANYNWDVDYPLDRIVFPYTGYPAYPAKERIYPMDKSPLEQMLDHYFALESAVFARQEMDRTVRELQAKGSQASLQDWQVFEGGYWKDAFPDPSRLHTLDSWLTATESGWDADPEENFHEVIGPALRLNLPSVSDPAKLGQSAGFGVRQILKAEPGIRSKVVRWEFSELPPGRSGEHLNELLRPAWNGMRRLPYSDADIAEALGMIVKLVTAGFESSIDGNVTKKRMSELIGDCMQVEFSYADGSGSRGFATKASLAKALRPDMAELLTTEFKDSVSDPYKLFRVIYNPRLIFGFEELKAVFAREIIPTQVLLNRSPILFNPALLRTFGNP